MKYTQFIGIDVSKQWLDVAIFSPDQETIKSKRILNDAMAIEKMFTDSSSPDSTLVCYEATGIYSSHLYNVLERKRIMGWQVNPIHVKRSSGLVRGKSDLSDAVQLAKFAFRYQDEAQLNTLTDKTLEKLKALVRSRESLVKVRTQLKQTLIEKDFYEPEVFEIKKDSIKATLTAIANDIKALEYKIDELLESNQKLYRLFRITCSVNGIGKVTAWELLIVTNAYQRIEGAKQLACYAGIAPFPYSSGSSLKGKARVSKMANKKMKKLLHMAALSSIRYHCDLREYYLRKVSEGKHKMSVLNAVRNKIINRVYACIKADKFYEHKLQMS